MGRVALRAWRAAASIRRISITWSRAVLLVQACASFAAVLSPTDLAAVVAYVATLNGVANPDD